MSPRPLDIAQAAQLAVEISRPILLLSDVSHSADLSTEAFLSSGLSTIASATVEALLNPQLATAQPRPIKVEQGFASPGKVTQASTKNHSASLAGKPSPFEFYVIHVVNPAHLRQIISRCSFAAGLAVFHQAVNRELSLFAIQVNLGQECKIPGQYGLIQVNPAQRALHPFLPPNTGYRNSHAHHTHTNRNSCFERKSLPNFFVHQSFCLKRPPFAKNGPSAFVAKCSSRNNREYRETPALQNPLNREMSRNIKKYRDMSGNKKQLLKIGKCRKTLSPSTPLEQNGTICHAMDRIKKPAPITPHFALPSDVCGERLVPRVPARNDGSGRALR